MAAPAYSTVYYAAFRISRRCFRVYHRTRSSRSSTRYAAPPSTSIVWTKCSRTSRRCRTRSLCSSCLRMCRRRSRHTRPHSRCKYASSNAATSFGTVRSENEAQSTVFAQNLETDLRVVYKPFLKPIHSMSTVSREHIVTYFVPNP